MSLALSLCHRPLSLPEDKRARVFLRTGNSAVMTQTSKRAVPFSKTKQKLSIIHLDFYRLFF